ncbi:MAG TPA: hypothetical protein VLE23_06015 [Geminicoccaceae bacterium]|nr:hypothetical protein [Geminicoccaceae bacterium]
MLAQRSEAQVSIAEAAPNHQLKVVSAAVAEDECPTDDRRKDAYARFRDQEQKARAYYFHWSFIRLSFIFGTVTASTTLVIHLAARDYFAIAFGIACLGLFITMAGNRAFEKKMLYSRILTKIFEIRMRKTINSRKIPVYKEYDKVLERVSRFKLWSKFKADVSTKFTWVVVCVLFFMFIMNFIVAQH